jgi:hypothetical protein
MPLSLSLVGIAAGLLLVGCADRSSAAPPPSAAAPLVAGGALPSFRARVLAAQQAQGASGPPRPRKLPAPVAMPNGGFRIDLRGSTDHVRTLDRQPDGSYKQACRNVPEISSARQTP